METNLTVFSLFLHADIVVQLVLFFLFGLSILCWSIIFDKIIRFKEIKNVTENFEKSFRSEKMLDKLHHSLKGKKNHPMEAIFVAAMDEWLRQPKMQAMNVAILSENIKNRLTQAMIVAHNKSVASIEKNMVILATVASAAPVIGLFGTVWGIMNSFTAIANEKNASLLVVAPGIAEALFATAVGLFAAIPAAIAYNYFTNKINNFNVRLEDFASELSNILSRQLDNIERGNI